jgi:competence protein ComEA
MTEAESRAELAGMPRAKRIVDLVIGARRTEGRFTSPSHFDDAIDRHITAISNARPGLADRARSGMARQQLRAYVLDNLPHQSASSNEARRPNLNTATVDEIAGVPGIGRPRAARIVRRRVSHGPFSSVDDLHGITNLGPRSREKIAGHFSFGELGE